MKVFCLFVSCLLALLGCSLGQEVDCPSEGISYLPHPDCTLYYICVNGQGIEEECPRPLYFNEELQRCDFPENVPECVGGTRPPIGGNSTTTTMRPTEEPTEEPSIPTSSNGTSTTPEPTEEPTVSPNSTTLRPPGILTQCGQTLEADSGIIEYKLNQTYDAGELCVFIVRVPKQYIMFELSTNGISNASDPDAITIHAYNTNLIVETHHLGPPNNVTDAFVNGNVAIVIFKSWENSTLGTGFRLYFQGFGESVNFPGKDFVFNNQSASPLELPFWTGNEGVVSTNFVVLTNGSGAISEPRTNLRLRLSEEFQNDDGTCFDFFWIYSLTQESVYREGVFCDADKDRSVYYTRGIFIVLFRKWLDSPLSKGTLTWDLMSE